MCLTHPALLSIEVRIDVVTREQVTHDLDHDGHSYRASDEGMVVRLQEAWHERQGTRAGCAGRPWGTTHTPYGAQPAPMSLLMLDMVSQPAPWVGSYLTQCRTCR